MNRRSRREVLISAAAAALSAALPAVPVSLEDHPLMAAALPEPGDLGIEVESRGAACDCAGGCE